MISFWRRWLVIEGLLVCALVFAGVSHAEETAPAPVPSPAPEVVKVVMHTAQGDIHLAIEKSRAPITAANFLRYVDQKRFDGITFYRAVKVSEDGKYGLMQGGLKGNPKLVLKPIAHEPTSATGLSHLDGTISMAR